MVKIVCSCQRSDEQLEAMFFETGHWVVNGQRGRVLCFAASLRHALERSAEYALSGTPVAAVCHLPFHKIVVSLEQIDRLLGIITIGGQFLLKKVKYEQPVAARVVPPGGSPHSDRTRQQREVDTELREMSKKSVDS
jgi:hypothetical protein